MSTNEETRTGPTPRQQVYREDERSRYQPPPCPVCGTTAEVDWIEVTLNARDLTENGRSYIPGRWTCPHNCNPVTGERWHGDQTYGHTIEGVFFRCSCGVTRHGLSEQEFGDLLNEHPVPGRSVIRQ
jgi:hypothetical protein